MDVLLQQLPTLAGVLLGVFCTWAATAATERARWRRTQSVRWDADRLAAYSAYAQALKRKISVILQIAAHRGVHTDVRWLPAEEDLAALRTAEDERTARWEMVLLLGSDEAVLAARRWHTSVFQMEQVARQTGTDVTWAEAVEATSRGRLDFYRVVKRDLGTARAIDPAAYEWQLARELGGQPDL